MFEELSLHLLDIAMNSLAANASVVEITVYEDHRHDLLLVRVRDNGSGMDARTLDAVLNNFATSKTARKKAIGLGIALLRQTAEMCAGHFHIRSAPRAGTSVTTSMRLSHIDRPPLGDIQSTILALCAANPAVDVRLRYRTDNQTYQFSSQEGSHDEPRRTQEAQRKSPTASRAA